MSINWPKIVAEHGQMVFQTAYRIVGDAADAEDVAQEVYVEAVRLASTVQIENWGAWLRKVAVFRALDRRRQKTSFSPLDTNLLASAELSPHDEAIRRELANRLRDLITSLPQREGAVFALRYFEHLSNSQIADTLGISTAAVAAASHKVRAKIEAAVHTTPTGDVK